jgi:sugar/nucleoside kinase (ribokinase family)
MNDIICIGHVTLDKIVTPQKEVYMPGGTTFYFAHGINSLLRSHKSDLSFKLVASLAESEMQSVEDMRKAGIEVSVVPSRKTVFFENIYGENQNDRQQRVRAKADPFTVESVKDLRAKYICLGSLLADDFPLEVVRYLSQQGTLVVDAQGYLRQVVGEEVHPCDWKDKLEYFKYIDVLKVNEHEIRTLTGLEDLHAALRQLTAWGIKEVLLTLGSEGSIVWADGLCHNISPLHPRQVVDATGCGDTYTMGYVYKRVQGASPAEAARFATAVSTIKLEASGPFCGTEAEAEQRLQP